MAKRSKKNALCPIHKQVVKKAVDLDTETFHRLVGRRARTILGKAVEPIKKKKDRLVAEKEISRFFEKINLGKDLLPARYLKEGAKRANAVCRIVTPNSLGTGSLIANGNFIMTNNHVIGSASVAGASTAEFGYEIGANKVRIALKPDQFFTTDRKLDFTIVACDSGPLNDVKAGEIMGDDAAIVRLDRSVRNFSRDVSDHVPVVFRMIYRDQPIDMEEPELSEPQVIKIPDGSSAVNLDFK